MRREIDELFGDVFERTGLRGRGFSPRVDVYYIDDPPRAVVKADLAGVLIEDVALEIRGRQLLIAGERRAEQAEGRLFQQIEIEHGPFRRSVELGADVVAERGQGQLRGRHPRGGGAAGPARRARPAGCRSRRRASDRDPDLRATGRRSSTVRPPACRTRCRCCRSGTACRSRRRSRRWRWARSARSSWSTTCWAATGCWRWSPSRDGRDREPGPGRPLRRGRGRHRGAHDQGARRHAADPGPRRPAGAARRVRPDRALPGGAGSPSCPTRSSPRPSSRRLFRNVQTTFSRDHRAGALPARGAADGGGQPRGPRGAGAHDRRGAADQDRGAPGAARGAGRGQAPAPPVRAARARARADLDRHQDPVAGRVRDRQGPARVLPAPAAEGDPGGAGRGRRAARPRPSELREQIEAAELPEHALQAGRARAAALRAPAARRPPSTA